MSDADDIITSFDHPAIDGEEEDIMSDERALDSDLQRRMTEHPIPPRVPMRLLVSREWLRAKIASDPDLSCEAGLGALPGFEELWGACVDAHFALGAWKESDDESWATLQDRANAADHALLSAIHIMSRKAP